MYCDAKVSNAGKIKISKEGTKSSENSEFQVLMKGNVGNIVLYYQMDF